jgi:prophage regulatory protein
MKILRLHHVIETSGLSRSTIYTYMSEGRFPKPIPLGERSVGWVESEVLDWILGCIEHRDQSNAASGVTGVAYTS